MCLPPTLEDDPNLINLVFVFVGFKPRSQTCHVHINRIVTNNQALTFYTFCIYVFMSRPRMWM